MEWREHVAREKRAAFRNEVYWGRPVPGFGDPGARVLIVGLAPAAHGGNRTGRVFTGVNLDANLGRMAVCAEAVALGRAVVRLNLRALVAALYVPHIFHALWAARMKA